MHRWLTDFPSSADARHTLAQFRLAEGDRTSALALLDESLNLDPERSDALEERGQALFRRREYERAKADFERLLANHPDHARGLYHLGTVYHIGFKNAGEGVKYYDRAIELSPTARVYFFERGRARIMLGQQAAALEDFDRAVQIDPQHGRSHFFRGRCLWFLGRHEEAERSFAVAESLDESTRTLVKDLRERG